MNIFEHISYNFIKLTISTVMYYFITVLHISFFNINEKKYTYMLLYYTAFFSPADIYIPHLKGLHPLFSHQYLNKK